MDAGFKAHDELLRLLLERQAEGQLRPISQDVAPLREHAGLELQARG